MAVLGQKKARHETQSPFSKNVGKEYDHVNVEARLSWYIDVKGGLLSKQYLLSIKHAVKSLRYAENDRF